MRARGWAIAAALILIAAPALAQEVTFSLGAPAGGGGDLATRTLQLMVLVTVIGVAPGLAVTVTCFPFIVTVLSILRQAIGLQQAPPNLLIVSLSLFLTWYVMDPVFTEAWAKGVVPFNAGALDLPGALAAASAPFRGFMLHRIDPHTFTALQALRPETAGAMADAPFSLIVPSFVLSEISRAFQIGFLIYLPFLIIDMVTAAVLMSMGMMMVPPGLVSLPFKLAFFVVANGWTLVSTALVRSYF